MLDRRKIVDLWQRGDSVALVTLVRVEGSSYRRVGARLLLAADGSHAGSISGGCLEAEVIRKAAWLVRNGAVVERYSTIFDDTAEVPYGLGCGGTVDLLLEPASTPEFAALMQAMQHSLSGNSLRVITRLPTATTALGRHVDHVSGVVARATVDGEEPDGEEAFTEVLSPPQRLLVFGAGDDAQPLVRMAALLGWSITVMDGRPQWATPQRFPEAGRVLAQGPGELTPEALAIHRSDAVVIMTHSYEQDRAWLAAVLPGRPRYLGLLGARHRSALLVSEVAQLLDRRVAEVCDGLFAPVGLDLGGDGAEAIALSVIAEIHALCEGKVGASKRMTAEIVAEQIEKGGASRYLQAQCAV